MVKLVREELNLQREQEARSFVGKNGLNYVSNFATDKEKKHFEGILYKNGNLDLTFISYLAPPINFC